MEANFKSYRSVLKFEYESRKIKDPAYSLRTYARDLELKVSQLSEILSKKKGLSPKRARKVGQRLAFRDEKLTWFLSLVEAEHSRSPLVRKQAKKKVALYHNGVRSQELQIDSLPFDFYWYHLAIRRMTLLADFNSEPEWIAKHLNVSVAEVRQACKDLLHAGLIKKNTNGNLIHVENVYLSRQAMNDKARTGVCRSMLQKSFESYSKPRENRRHHGNHIFTISRELLPEMMDLIRDFIDKLDYLTYKSDQHNELMAVIVHAFPLMTDAKSKGS